MRPRHVITPLALALAARVIVRYRRRRRAQRAAETSLDCFASNPRDPVQRLDEVPELEGTPLEVEAVSQADVAAAEDLAILEDAVDETADRDTEAIAEAAADESAVIAQAEGDEPARERDAGDLYGAHTPPSSDRDHPDDDRAFDCGQNWLEALETSAVENGPEPERELADVVDDEDVLRPPHASDTRDTPVADRGAGGRAGL
jgi:thioesterase domain-containing protein